MNLTLCDYKFDKDNSNVLLFNDKSELKAYFDNLTNKVLIENINFNARDIINTSVIVNIPNQLALFELLNYNYCFVEQENASTLYYFIERSYQESGNQIRLDLRLDAWNTYIYDCMSENKPLNAMIQRTHLERFSKQKTTGEPDYYFNFGLDSKLYERETIKDVAKYVADSVELFPYIDIRETISNEKYSTFNTFIRNNVAGWIYIYLSGNVEYEYLPLSPTPPTTPVYTKGTMTNLKYINSKGASVDQMNSGFVVLCAPIYKKSGNGVIQITQTLNSTTKAREWTIESLYEFINKQDGGFANVQSIKFSIMPPLELRKYTRDTESETDFDYSINGNNLVLNGNNGNIIGTDTDKKFLMSAVGVSLSGGLTYKAYYRVDEYDISKALPLSSDLYAWEPRYQADEIKGKNIEPKLYNEDYSVYRLIFGGQQFELPISKTDTNLSFLYKEILTPDITKGILILDSDRTYRTTYKIFNKDTIYTNINEKDFTGFSFTIDLSMWYPSNSLENYLANNKNFLQIFKNEQTANALKMLTGFVTHKPKISNISQGLADYTINSAFDLVKMDLTLDNMKNSPEQTTNLNSNALLIQSISGFNILLEILKPLPFEQEIIKDYLNAFGYTYNKLGNIYDFIKTRKYFNYLQGIVYDIDAHISEQVKDQIKNIFINGVRVWHADATQNIDFKLINYERSIENEQ